VIFSFSRLQLYSHCPAAFYYKYLLDLPEPPSEPLVLGKAVHSAIQRYLGGDNMETAVHSSVDDAELPLDLEEVRSLASHPAVMSVMGGTVEDHFCLPLDNGGNVLLQGYIDWWKDDASGIHILDWKTNRSPYLPRDNQQLGLYAWALGQLTGADEVHGELVFLRYSYSAMRYNHTYALQDMSKAREWALGLALDIEGKLAQMNVAANTVPDTILFPDKPGVHCQHCGYSGICIRAVTVNPVVIDDMPAATKLAREVIRLEAAVSDYKDHLKSWVKTNGDVSVDDSVFTFVPSSSWHFTDAKLKELCTELDNRGIDYWQYLSMTAAQLKKAGLGDGEISLFGAKRETNTFRLIKAG